MNILLTNDDGYNYQGLVILQKLLKKYGHVVVVAPEGAMSAKSVAITIGAPLTLRKVEEDVYALNGTPADCVAFALVNFNVKFDLVVSGCNNGWNISYDTIYSGTVGACLNAMVGRVPAIAFSSYNADFTVLEEWFDQTMNFILNHHLLSEKYLLNVNFPMEFANKIEIGELYYRHDEYFYTHDEKGYYAYRKMEENFSSHPKSDCYQVHNHIVSIVPLGRTNYSEALYQELKKKVKA